MNIFKKISYANKAVKIYEEIRDYDGAKEIKEGIDLIKQGVEKIAVVIPDIKEFVENLRKSFNV